MEKIYIFKYPLEKDSVIGWDKSVDYEQLMCTSKIGHMRAGKRTEILDLVILEERIPDILWTMAPECIIQDHVLKIFQKEKLTGFEVKPVNARYKDNKKKAPNLWELVITGWGGVAPEESGIKFLDSEKCEVCGKIKYSAPTDFLKIFSLSQWDGSDFFIIWPLPKFYFVTERVLKVLQKYNLSDFSLLRLEEYNFSSKKISPGRLHYYMPDARAHELGDPLGIY